MSGLFIDAVAQDTVNLGYPKPETKSNGLMYRIGNGAIGDSPSWCLSSAYLVATPIRELPSLSLLYYMR